MGGLIGQNLGLVTDCFATGLIVGVGDAGGFVGVNFSDGTVENSFATGNATGGTHSTAGGFAGYNEGTMQDSYSTGVPSGGEGSSVGGFVGDDASAPGSLADTYWDTTTSGITDLSQGAGNIANDPGITGLSAEQLQSALPTGFSPTIWGENANINGGLPYLLVIPPAKKQH